MTEIDNQNHEATADCAPMTCCAAPSELVETIKELNAHIERLESIGGAGVACSVINAYEQRKMVVAALCEAQHNVPDQLSGDSNQKPK